MRHGAGMKPRALHPTPKGLIHLVPVLQNPDPTRRYIMDTDASQFAVGATISQDFSDGRTQ